MANEARFNDLFDQWAEDYDLAVSGGHPEYIEVFEGYADILKTVVESLSLPKGSVVMEFGVGTGNLSRLLLAAGYRVIGIEPSAAMREKAKSKLPELELYEGHFLHIPDGLPPVDGIVSTYAFHHLTDEEKDRALRDFARRLRPGGRIVFADTVFLDEETKQAMQQEAEKRGFHELALDLNREYYPVVERLKSAFHQAGLTVRLKQLNRYVWLMVAERREGDGSCLCVD
jgi:putative AdoMet-dependent methyltransferase